MDIDGIGGERLRTLRSYEVLDTEPEAVFDEIVRRAARVCGTPLALVTLVDEHRQWFKAKVGTDLGETLLDQSVCTYALAQREILVIPDLSEDPRTMNNPLVTGGSHFRFYAGAPLVAFDGHVLGTLCVVDDVARPEGLTDSETAALGALASEVMRQLEERRPKHAGVTGNA